MKIYKVTSRIHGAGYYPGDSATSGGSYDLYEQRVMTASSKIRVSEAMEKFYRVRGYRVTHKIEELGDA